MREAFPALPQVAVFDTAFHQTLPEHAYLYAVPKKLYRDHGVRRYGFHGTSHRFVAEEAARRLGLTGTQSRIVTAHLGSGCSTCAVLGGQSVDTSMGLSPLEGLVMGTRSGDVDPGLHSFLAERLGLDLADIHTMLNRESGLLGLSELSGDMRELEQAAEDGHAQARLAIEIFTYRLARQIAGLLVPLNGLDALVFTGGIGENSSRIRANTVDRLSHLDLSLDEEMNRSHGTQSQGRISADQGPAIMVIPTDEELLIAQQAAMRLAK
jgi:acetate kinase